MGAGGELRSVDDLAALAAVQVRGSNFGSDSWREGLAILLNSVRHEANPSRAGVQAIEASVTQLLINRLQINRWYRDHPQIADETIAMPVFSVGMVRTGTTALSFLLDQDPDNRSLIHWQAMAPCPPPETAHLHDDPRIAVIEQLMPVTGLRTAQKSMIELLSDGPAECLHLLSMDFKSGHFEGMLNLPSYHDWLFATDLRSAYEWHKKTLKLLQWRAPTKRWMLKYPSHTIALPAIRDVYPNARFIATHRDPSRTIVSVCSLIHHGAGNLSENLDLHRLGAHWTEIVEEQLRRMIAFRDAGHDGMFIDLQNDELVRKPMESLERLYDWMGVEITPAARAGFESRINSNPKGVYGVHSYDPETYGLDTGALAERFKFYTERFGVRSER